MSETFLKYCLKDNPFPKSAIINPLSGDPKINGTIFNEEVFEEEIADLTSKIDRRTNLVYVSGTAWERGLGKSALIIRKWRELQSKAKTSSIYVRAESSSTPQAFCMRIVLQWHEKGLLWETLKRCLLRYSKEVAEPRISKESAEVFAERHPALVTDRLDLSAFTYSKDLLVTELVKWSSGKSESIMPEIPTIFFKSYLSNPSTFPEEYRKLKKLLREFDDIDYFKAVFELMKLAEYEFHHFFIDQFEDSVVGHRRDLSEFTSDMRRVLESCMNDAVFVVTVHPDSISQLNEPEGSYLTSIAPLDKAHTVDIETLDASKAIELVFSYLSFYRDGIPPENNRIYPFNEEAIKYFNYLSDGIPRRLLETLHNAIEVGIATKQYPSVDLDFIRSKHEETTGQKFDQKRFDDFYQNVLGSG